MLTPHQARPFLKWAGGKGQLLSQLEESLPSRLSHENFTYIEPFVGGGAMLFFMLQKFPNIKNVIINDINKRLTDAYLVIKNMPHELVVCLKEIENEYKSLHDEECRKEFFLCMRHRFNENNGGILKETALLIFLNRTCFNGLYRENSKGQFNVPFGKYANPIICNEDIIYADSEILNRKNVLITNGDFTHTYRFIDKNTLTFFYFDPPYRPLSSTSSFNSYVNEKFDDSKQHELSDFCHTLSSHKNCLWMLSNSDCSAKNPDDLFFETIYKDFTIKRVHASRSVNAIAEKRGKLTELLIRNYETDKVQLHNII